MPMDALRPIESKSMKESAYASIERAILCCDLTPGTLLSDRQLSDALGISRTPVREALQSSEAPGFVGRRRRVGWVVAGFSRADVSELFEIRRMVEPVGLEKLARNWDSYSTGELSNYFERFKAPLIPEAYHEYLRRDYEFHKQVVDWSVNSRLIQFYEVVEKQIDRTRHYLAPRYAGRIHSVVEEHWMICAAMGERDFEAARQRLLEHLYSGERAMIRFMEEQPTKFSDHQVGAKDDQGVSSVES